MYYFFEPLDFNDRAPVRTFGVGEAPDPWAEALALALAPEEDDE